MRQDVMLGKHQAPFAKIGIKKQSGEDIARLRRAFLLSGGHPPAAVKAKASGNAGIGVLRRWQ